MLTKITDTLSIDLKDICKAMSFHGGIKLTLRSGNNTEVITVGDISYKDFVKIYEYWDRRSSGGGWEPGIQYKAWDIFTRAQILGDKNE